MLYYGFGEQARREHMSDEYKDRYIIITFFFFFLCIKQFIFPFPFAKRSTMLTEYIHHNFPLFLISPKVLLVPRKRLPSNHIGSVAVHQLSRHHLAREVSVCRSTIREGLYPRYDDMPPERECVGGVGLLGGKWKQTAT